MIIIILVILILISCSPKRKTGRVFSIYLPVVQRYPGFRGVGINGPADAVRLVAQFKQAHPRWLRTDLIWYQVEAVQGTYNWNTTQFDKYYSDIIATGAEPIVILKMAPEWARTRDKRTCGRIDPDKIAAFAAFARAAAARYTRVNYWEIWNEEDTPVGYEDSFGCWGDPSDAYYGGGYYASVIVPVYNAIKAQDASNQVVFGGLMMNMGSGMWKYFEGAVRAGARFDVVSFHFYAWFATGITVPTLQLAELNRVMTVYNYKKPVILTEVSLLYGDSSNPAVREKLQADYVFRINDWAKQNKLMGWLWYTLGDSGWNHSGLMEGSREKPAFYNFISYDD